MSVLANKIKNDYGKKTLAETTRELYPVDKEVLNEAVMEIFVFLIALLGGLAYFSLEDLVMKRSGVRAVFKKINIDLEDRKLTLNQIVKYIKKHGNKEDVQKIKEVTKRIRKNTKKEFWVLATNYITKVRPEDITDILKIYDDIKTRGKDVKTKEKDKKELILESRPVKGSRSGLKLSDEIIGVQLGHNIHKPKAVKDREEAEAAAEAERKARRSKYNKTAYKKRKEKNKIAQAIRSKNLEDLKTAEANWRNNATKALERDDKIVLTKPVEKKKKVISTKVRSIF